MLESFLIGLMALGGLVLCLYLSTQKRRQSQPLICPFHGNCADVIHSQFSHFFGIPVERIGVAYYGILLIGHSLLLALPDFFSWLESYLLFASSMALLFSLYLTFIQLVVLKKICTWCLLSAALCLSIFLTAVIGGLEMVFPLLLEYRPMIVALHVLFMALGLGAATLTDIFFFRFLKDLRISQAESDVLGILSQCIWFALCFIILSGLALYLPQAGHYHDVPKFVAKMVVVGVILVNGAFLNLYIAPKLVKISFAEPHKHKEGELILARRLAFALGPISIVSWYCAFILGSIPASTPLSFLTFLKIYLAVLVLAITIGQFVERRMSKREGPWIHEV
jgi:uncharacterized membrane protein